MMLRREASSGAASSHRPRVRSIVVNATSGWPLICSNQARRSADQRADSMVISGPMAIVSNCRSWSAASTGRSEALSSQEIPSPLAGPGSEGFFGPAWRRSPRPQEISAAFHRGVDRL